ncbi:MAG: hypothetical protein Q4G63_09135, partial [Bacteroidia bacterium]|nr:hypothetical protein [Bacteroidia bacterium]
MSRIIFCIFIPLLCLSCNSKESVSFFANKSYEDCGTFFDKDSGNELVFFAKRNFNSNIKIFDLRGNLKDSLSLANTENLTGKISKIWMTSKDS